VVAESLLAEISVPSIVRSPVLEGSQRYVTAVELVGANFDRSFSSVVICKSILNPTDLEFSNADKFLNAVEIQDQTFVLPGDITPDTKVLIS